MPVMLVTWNAGRLAGVVMAGMAAVAAQAADIIDGEAGHPSWNAVVWLCVFMLTVWLLSALKESMLRQGARMGELLAEEEVLTGDLRQQNDLKDTLLHAVAHDLKGPLAGILGAMQTIRRAGDLGLTDAEMEDLYGVIEQAGTKAARLIDDLLDLDRLGRGQLTIDREPADVAEIGASLRLGAAHARRGTPSAWTARRSRSMSTGRRSSGSSRTCSTTPHGIRRWARRSTSTSCRSTTAST